MERVNISGVHEIIAEAVAAADQTGTDDPANEGIRLNEYEVYRALACLGLHHAPCAYLPEKATSEERESWARQALCLAAGDERLVLKAVGRDLLHKTEVGAVTVLEGDEIATPDAVLTAVTAFAERLSRATREEGIEGMLAAAFVPHRSNQPGQELLLSVRLDPAFGPVVVIGVGGTLTEWYGRGSGGGSRVIFPAVGFDPARATETLLHHPLISLVVAPSRLYPEPPLAVAEVVTAAQKLAQLAVAMGPGRDLSDARKADSDRRAAGNQGPATGGAGWTLEELEINPAVAAGGRLVALDGVGLVSRASWPTADRPISKIVPLLGPRSAVVMGVSTKGANPGRIILENLLQSPGISSERIYVVHPKESSIGGVPCFRGVSELPEKCDLAVVAIPAEGALASIEELVEHDKAESIILIPGGFAEAGQADLAARIEAVLQAGHRLPTGGPVMVGGNCLGIVSRGCYNTFFLPEYKLPFRPGRGENLALVSQSGAYLVTFASNYDGIISPRASISFGNQMDLTAADFLEHYIDDAEVDVVAFYVEGFKPGDGARFLAAIRKARAGGKRVVVFKAGKTVLGARAAASHTASLAGDYDVARACLQAAGATVAETLDEFEDLIKTFTLLAGKRATGRRVGIMSNAGFECSAVMDALGDLELATFDQPTRAVLAEALPPFAHQENPIDCTPMTGTEPFSRSTEAILACAAVDVAIISSVPVTPALDNLSPDPWGAHPENIHAAGSQPRRLIEIMTATDKPAVVVVDSGRIYDPMAVLMERAGLPVFRKIDRAARALAAFCAGI